MDDHVNIVCSPAHKGWDISSSHNNARATSALATSTARSSTSQSATAARRGVDGQRREAGGHAHTTIPVAPKRLQVGMRSRAWLLSTITSTATNPLSTSWLMVGDRSEGSSLLTCEGRRAIQWKTSAQAPGEIAPQGWRQRSATAAPAAPTPPHLLQLVAMQVHLQPHLLLAHNRALRQRRAPGSGEEQRRDVPVPSSHMPPSTDSWQLGSCPSAVGNSTWELSPLPAASSRHLTHYTFTCSSSATSSILVRLAGSAQAALLATRRVVEARMVDTTCSHGSGGGCRYLRIRTRANPGAAQPQQQPSVSGREVPGLGCCGEAPRHLHPLPAWPHPSPHTAHEPAAAAVVREKSAPGGCWP